MPRPKHIEVDDVVEQRSTPSGQEAGRVMRVRRGTVLKMEKVCAIVMFERAIAQERVPLNRLTVVEPDVDHRKARVVASAAPLGASGVFTKIALPPLAPPAAPPVVRAVPPPPPPAPPKVQTMKQYSAIEDLTPEQAGDLLNANTDNRPIRDARVSELTRSIREGRWHLTNDAIAMTGFSKDEPGRLLNGQHRLFACNEAGMPITVLVLYGATEEAFPVMDTGAKRMAADVLGGTYSKTVAAAARLILANERGTLTHAGGIGSYGHDEVIACAQRHPEIHDCAERYYGRLLRMTRSGGGVVAGLALLVQRAGDEGHAFAERMIEGVDLSTGDPEHTLRERLIREATSSRSKRLPAAFYTALVVKAWNAARAGHKLTRLIFAEDEAFPVVAPMSAPAASPSKRARYAKAVTR